VSTDTLWLTFVGAPGSYHRVVRVSCSAALAGSPDGYSYIGMQQCGGGDTHALLRSWEDCIVGSVLCRMLCILA
jgi:hypothetical protein